ncbi:MAG: ABC transporter permease [Actinomycetales bacterium]
MTAPVPTAPGPGAVVRSTGRFLASELRLLFGRRRNQVALLALAAVPVIIAAAIRWNDGPRRDGRAGPDFFSSITGNGIFVGFAGLVVELGLFLPVVVAMFSGDAVAGEAHGGTLRYLLAVPVGRVRLLVVKYLAVVVGCVAASLVVAGAGVIAGSLLFGTGDVTTLSGVTISLPVALWRLGLSALYVAAGLAALAAVGLFISTLTEQPIAAMVATVAFSTISWILDSVPQLDWLHPWLLVHRWQAFADLLREPPHLEVIGVGLAVDAGYAVVFLLAAWARFAGKDITS